MRPLGEALRRSIKPFEGGGHKSLNGLLKESIILKSSRGSEVISPSGKRSPNHKPLGETTLDPLGFMLGQGPGGLEKTLKGLVCAPLGGSPKAPYKAFRGGGAHKSLNGLLKNR